MLNPIKAIPSWATSDGVVHTDRAKSLRHEIELWLRKAGDNVVGARNIVAAMDKETLSPLIDLLELLEDELDSPSVYQVVRG
jgi:hypothetical protein